MRKAAREALNKEVLNNGYHPIFLREAVILAFGLVKDSATQNNHIHQATLSALVTILYNKEPLKSMKDPVIAWLHKYSCQFMRAAMLGAHLVEIFTWMRHIPSWQTISTMLSLLYTDMLKQICGMEA